MADKRNASTELLERPLTARSVLASLLLGRHPPSAPVSLLVRWCALFGISETSTRVALSRMVERDELSAQHGTYALAGRVRERQADQEFSLAPTLTAWDGTWLMAIVPDGRREAADRVALRDALRRSRMVAWSATVWLRPDNLGGHPATPADRRVIEAQCTWWRGRPDDVAAIDVERAYGLEALGARGRALLPLVDRATENLPEPAQLAEAFVVGAAVAQHLRRDPLLPAELLPPAWPGDDLRAAYRRYVAAMDAAVRAWSMGAT